MIAQLEKDIQASRRTLQDARTGAEKVHKELVKLTKETEAIEVSISPNTNVS
jgi:hypothetical protein